MPNMPLSWHHWYWCLLHHFHTVLNIAWPCKYGTQIVMYMFSMHVTSLIPRRSRAPPFLERLHGYEASCMHATPGYETSMWLFNIGLCWSMTTQDVGCYTCSDFCRDTTSMSPKTSQIQSYLLFRNLCIIRCFNMQTAWFIIIYSHPVTQWILNVVKTLYYWHY